MLKIRAKEFALLAIPPVGLLTFATFLSNSKRGTSSPTLVLKSLSVDPGDKQRPNRGYRGITMRFQYNPRNWIEGRQPPKISGLGFDLVDDTGKKYSGVTTGYSSMPVGNNNIYEVRYDFLVDQLIPQMPPTAKQVTLKSTLTGSDGRTIPITTVVYRRK